MADTSEKVKLAFDEARLLVLGSQILLGFQFRAFLEPGFQRLPALSQNLRLVSLVLMLIAMLLLMWPATFHEIVERGDLTQRLLRFATRVMGWALLPFGAALGLDLYTVTQKLGGQRIAVCIGAGMSLVALFFWYGLEFAIRLSEARSGKRRTMSDTAQPRKETSLDEKIDTVLTECRVVIPGSQALLGFQLIAMLMDGFDRLPPSSRLVHLASLLLILLSTILLMSPAAYHRIVERGEDTERFWRYARLMLLSAMAILAAGIATELFVVIRQLTGSIGASTIGAVLTLLTFYGAWFGYTGLMRARIRGAEGRVRSAE
jgi:hypothetical protein